MASGVIASACSHDWDRYDPGAEPASTSSASLTTSAGVTTSTTTATSTSTGTGGADSGTGSTSSSGGVVTGIACGSNKLVPLSDNFTTEIDPTVWTIAKDVSRPVGLDDTGGNVSLDIPLGPLTWGGVIVSSLRYDMRSCAVFVEAKNVPVDTSVYMNLIVKLDPDKNFVEFTYQEGKLQFKYTLSGVPTILSTCDTPYKAAQHRYWRIRVDSGTTYWESSVDTKNWSMLCSKKIAFPYENVLVGFGAGTWVVTMPTDGGATTNKVAFDNFNVAP